MRFYGKRFLNQSIQKQMEGRIETRDAILWDVLPDQRICRVKIQGSNQLIVAHYPENWEKTPVYLKPGNAVRITHRMGVRGKIEIVGHGQVVPTPVSGDSSPPLGTDEDGVLTGCIVTASIPPAMTVAVGTGTYQISEEEYTISSEQEVAVGAAPAYGYYRQDLIQIDASGVPNCKAGTPATSDPVAPDPDSGHIALGTVLVPWGNTTILSQYVNVAWTTPAAKTITIVPDDDDLAWAETQTDIVVTVIDQYGNGITTDSPGWHLTLEIVAGNGEVWSIDDGWQTTSVSADTGANSYYTFKYKRDQLSTDESPTLKASVDGIVATAYVFITVRDEDGNAMGEGYTDPGALQVYQTVQDEGTPLTQRKIINFIGAGVTAEDDAVNEVTKVTIGGGGGSGDVVGPAGATDSDICEFDTATGKLIKDGGLAHDDVSDAISAMHDAATAGTGLDISGQELSLEERNANLALFPEYAGATMSPSGANNNPGIYGMTSDFEAVGTSIYNYYEWKSSITTGLQSYDINTKIPIPFNFTGLQVGVSVALTVDIKTEENTTDNNKIDITLQRDGNAATSALTNQKSAVAATWVAVGFDETDAVLAALVAGDILNVTIRMYSQNSKYARVGKINIQMKLQ